MTLNDAEWCWMIKQEPYDPSVLLMKSSLDVSLKINSFSLSMLKVEILLHNKSTSNNDPWTRSNCKVCSHIETQVLYFWQIQTEFSGFVLEFLARYSGSTSAWAGYTNINICVHSDSREEQWVSRPIRGEQIWHLTNQRRGDGCCLEHLDSSSGMRGGPCSFQGSQQRKYSATLKTQTYLSCKN